MTPATTADIPRIVEMGRKFHIAAGIKAPFCEHATTNTVRGLIESDTGTVIVSDAGMIGGALAPAYCSANWTMAVELFWWAEDRRGLHLLKAFEQWAEDMGADEVRMTTIHGLDGAARILDRRGYSACEISHGKAL